MNLRNLPNAIKWNRLNNRWTIGCMVVTVGLAAGVGISSVMRTNGYSEASRNLWQEKQFTDLEKGQQMVEQIRLGMTIEQVEKILGKHYNLDLLSHGYSIEFYRYGINIAFDDAGKVVAIRRLVGNEYQSVENKNQ
jgi:hypothetical protein